MCAGSVLRVRADQDTPTDNDTVTRIIEEIAPDDMSKEKDFDVVIDEHDPKTCLNCGFRMIELKSCMLRCSNCGATKDCSEKGIW